MPQTAKDIYSKLNTEASKLGLKTYIDPESGYSVFTTAFHLNRGNCCGNTCRHCPYDYVNVKKKKDSEEEPKAR